MHSGNDQAAVRNLLSAKEWTRSDGRSSYAMLMLLEELRAFKRKGLLSGIVAFADTYPEGIFSIIRGKRKKRQKCLR
jgi:hypothetical protein